MIDSNIKKYDVHVAADIIPADLPSRLAQLGFIAKPVLGSDPHVHVRHLWSLATPNKSSADECFVRTVTLLDETVGFRGYIEEEAIVHDSSIDLEQVSAPDPNFLETFSPSRAPHEGFKACDLHASAVAIAPELAARFIASGFYFLALEKSGGKQATVYTMQFMDMAAGKDAWRRLQAYLTANGGFTGGLKFEVTINLKNYGFELPPVVAL